MENTDSPKKNFFDRKLLPFLTIRLAAGIGLGLLGGFLYFHFIGCQSGTCPITSSPFFSMLFGGLFGLVLSVK